MSAMARGTSGGSGSNYMLIPPPNFAYIEESLCRCTLPLQRNALGFLDSLGVDCVVNVSGKKLDPDFISHCDENGIVMKTLLHEGDNQEMSNVAVLREWIARSLELLLQQSSENLTLLIGSTETLYDCLLIACLRRLQGWSFVSTIAEYRHLMWPTRMFDFEQMIECFDPSLVNCSSSMPDYLLVHCDAKVGELEIIQRQQYPGDGSGSNDTEKDAVLMDLFFSPPNAIMSEDVEVDFTLSLINEKDDDD